MLFIFIFISALVSLTCGNEQMEIPRERVAQVWRSCSAYALQSHA